MLTAFVDGLGTPAEAVPVGDLDVSAGGLGAAPDGLLLLAAALVLEGLWPTRARPAFLNGGLARLFGDVALRFEGRLNRPSRSQSKRLFRGAVVVVLVEILAIGLGVALSTLQTEIPFVWLAGLAVLVTSVGARTGWEDARAVASALTTGATDAQRAAAPLLGAEAATMDGPAIARAMVQRLGDRFALDVVAPAFWFVLLGLPGLLAMIAATAAARAMPEQSARFEEFGMAAARLRAALALLPAWLAAILVAIAATATPGASPALALGALGASGTRFRARGSSVAAAAMAAAFNIAVPVLDLARAAAPANQAARWAGNADAVMRSGAATDVRRAAYLYRVARLELLALVVLLALAKFAA